MEYTTSPEIHEDKYTLEARKHEWKAYGKLKFGLLHPNLLKYFWSDCLEYVSELEVLCVKNGILVPIFTGTQESVENRQFLVPAHLPKVLPTTTCHADQLVSYLVFASPEILQQWRKRGYLSVKEAKEDGVLPCSFFVSFLVSLTAQLVSHSQCVYDMSYDDMELSQREVVISFQKHKFRMQELPGVNMFQITIQVETAILIVDTILSVAAKTLASMTTAQGVKVAMAVPADGGKLTAGLTADGEKPIPNGYLVITDGEGGLQQRVDSNTSIALGPGADRRTSPLEGRRIFAPWLLPTGARQYYDVYFSYRWAQFDSEIMQAIYPIISAILLGKHNRPVQSFLDRHCLQVGQNFSDESSAAFMNSTGILPVVSCAALERMVSLTPESPIDNILLEWTLALELKDEKGTFFVIPLVVGRVSPERKLSNGSFSTSLFEEGIIHQLPQVVCNKTVAEAKAILLKHGLTPSANLETRTVRQTVEDIIRFLGVMASDVKISDVGGSVDADLGHDFSMWKSAVCAKTRTKVVECLEAAEITLGDVRQRQEQEAEARRRKQEEESLKEEEEILSSLSIDEKKHPVTEWLSGTKSLEQYSQAVMGFGYDSMDALYQASEKDVIEMTEDASIGMKKPHRTLFINAWKTLLKTSLSPQRTFASKEEEIENMIAEYDPSSGILSKDQFTKFCQAIQNGSNPFESPAGADKFCAEPKAMKMGDFQQAAGGLFKLMNVNKKETSAKALLGGVPAVKEEVEKLKTNQKFCHYYPVVSKYLNYILHEPASEQAYPNGIRDKDHAGLKLSDFAEHPFAKEADLDEAEVVALRLYTTPAFVAINEPLRNLEEGVEHPLPVLVTILAEALRKLRQIGSNDMAAVSEMFLWRGMKNLKPSDEFKTRGGTELAPMSTTTDIKTAVQYSLSSESSEGLIFMIVTKNALQRGASLSWLSAFPTEEESCFPPLTYLQPTGKAQVVEINGMRFTIVEVAPSN